MENEQAYRQNRSPIPVVIQKLTNDSQLGGYLPQEGIILINENLLGNQYHSNFKALETIIHEGHHREQHLLVMGDDKVLSYLTKRRDYREEVTLVWSENMRNYRSASSTNNNYEAYVLQPIEIDTITRTLQEMVFIDSPDNLYQDKDYQLYLAQKSTYIEKCRTEAIKIYGVNFEMKLDQIRKISVNNPELAKDIESGYLRKRVAYDEGRLIKMKNEESKMVDDQPTLSREEQLAKQRQEIEKIYRKQEARKNVERVYKQKELRDAAIKNAYSKQEMRKEYEEKLQANLETKRSNQQKKER